MVSSNVRYRLREIVQTHGRSLARNPQRCDAYLADLLPKNQQFRKLLVQVIRSGLIEEMLPQPELASLSGLIRKFTKEADVSHEVAEEVILSWAYALTEDPIALEKIKTTPSTNWVGVAGIAALCGLLVFALFGMGNLFLQVEESDNASRLNQTVLETTTIDAPVVDIPTMPAAIKPSPKVVVEKKEPIPQPEVIREKVIVQDEKAFAKGAYKAIRYVQDFAAFWGERQKKLDAQAVIAQLKQKTNSSYYRDQYRLLQGEIDGYNQKLDQSSQEYAVLVKELCGWVVNHSNYQEHVPKTLLFEVLERQLKRCPSEVSGTREFLESDLRQSSVL